MGIQNPNEKGVCSSEEANQQPEHQLEAEEWCKYGIRYSTGALPEGDDPKITAKQCFENALEKDKTCKQAWLCLKEAGGGHVTSNHLSVEYKPAACQAEHDKIVAEEDRKAHQHALMKDKLSKK